MNATTPLSPDYFDTSTGQPVTEYMLLQRWNELLDSADDILIGGRAYSPSLAMQRVDPIAYRCDFLDWINSLLVGGELSETDPDAGWSDVPVDSTYHACCHAIGGHGRDCQHAGVEA